MPHINSRGGDDLASTDEVKVYNDEGAEELEQRSSEKFLSEDKLGLVTETEQDKTALSGRGFQVATKNPGGSEDKSIGPPPANDHLNHFSYFYRPYTNGATSLSAGGKMPAVGFQPHPGLMPYGDIMTQPPPAHSGIQVVPAMHIDPKTGLPRSTLFPLHPASAQYSMYQELAASVPGWPGAAGYAMPPVGGFHATPYMRYMAAAAVAGGLLSPHPSLSPHSPVGLQQSALVGQGLKQETALQHHVYDAAAAASRYSNHAMGSSSSGTSASNGEQPVASSRHHSESSSSAEPAGGCLGAQTPGTNEKKPRVHIKKPLNAFMLFMKEMRAKVVSECTLKESAAINQILGRKWHALDRVEQAKYYDMAKKEREQHMKLYPGWSARDNYAMHSKKKKKQQLLKDASRNPSLPASTSAAGASAAVDTSFSTSGGDSECIHPKKCRARYGLERQSQWCKPCRRSAVAAYGCQRPSSATPVPAAAAAAAPDCFRRKKKCVNQYMSSAQGQGANGGSSFENSVSDDDCSMSDDAADNYGSPASTDDPGDSDRDELIMVQGDSDEEQEINVNIPMRLHQRSTQRSRVLIPAAGSALEVMRLPTADDRTCKDTSVKAINQEHIHKL